MRLRLCEYAHFFKHDLKCALFSPPAWIGATVTYWDILWYRLNIYEYSVLCDFFLISNPKLVSLFSSNFVVTPPPYIAFNCHIILHQLFFVYNKSGTFEWLNYVSIIKHCFKHSDILIQSYFSLMKEEILCGTTYNQANRVN